MSTTLRTRAMLTLTGLAAIVGLVVLPGSASAATCTSANAPADIVDATASNGLIQVAPGGPKVYKFGNSPYVGARYNKCLRTLKVYFGGYQLKDTKYYNVRLYDGRLIKIEPQVNGTWTPKTLSAKDPGYHFSVQACNASADGKKVNCTAWSPTVGLTGSY